MRLRRGIDPPFWWKPWLALPSLRDWWTRPREVKVPRKRED